MNPRQQVHLRLCQLLRDALRFLRVGRIQKVDAGGDACCDCYGIWQSQGNQEVVNRSDRPDSRQDDHSSLLVIMAKS